MCSSECAGQGIRKDHPYGQVAFSTPTNALRPPGPRLSTDRPRVVLATWSTVWGEWFFHSFSRNWPRGWGSLLDGQDDPGTWYPHMDWFAFRGRGHASLGHAIHKKNMSCVRQSVQVKESGRITLTARWPFRPPPMPFAPQARGLAQIGLGWSWPLGPLFGGSGFFILFQGTGHVAGVD